MFKNNIKIAWRSLKKQPFFTFLNIFGLAIGMAGGLLLGLYIYDDLSHDKMFVDADRIYRINADMKFGGAEERTAEVSAPMAEALVKDIPEVEMATRFRNIGSISIRLQDVMDNVREHQIAYADATFFCGSSHRKNINHQRPRGVYRNGSDRRSAQKLYFQG